MRGGTIFVEKDAGYRCGIHMKEYGDKSPQIVIGGRCGSFLGEYQAGGIILVLGIGVEDRCPVGELLRHGDAMGGRSSCAPPTCPRTCLPRVCVKQAEAGDKEIIRPLVEGYCARFGGEAEALLQSEYFLLTPNSQNPYRQMYVHN